nr:hypothetical protein [Luteibacter rhizovicinus]
MYGNLSQNWQGIARSVVGNTIGNAIADQVVDRPTYRFDVSKGGQGVGSSGSGYSAGGLISDGPAFVNVGSQEWGALPDGVIPADGPVSYDGALALDEANRMPGQSQEVGTYPLIGTSLDGQRISFQGAPAIVANLQEPDGRSGFLYKDDTSTFGAPDRSAIRSENLMAASTMTSTVGPEQGIWGDLVGSFKAWRAGDIGFGQASSMFLSDFKYHLQTSNKVQGSVRVGAGVLELAGDVLAAGATEGAGVPLLVVSAAHAGGNIGTGFSQLLNDEPAENLSYSGTLALTGSPRVARAVDQGVPLLAAAVQTASISNGANLATGAVTRLSASELEDFNAGAKSFAAGVPDKVSPPNLTERGTLTNLRPQDISVSERPIRALVQDDSGRYWLQSAGGNRITPSGSYDFVTMPDGTIRVARPNNTWDFSTHLGLSGGGEVNWAGSIRFGNNMGPNRGTILEWTNNSGHYQPPAYLSGNAGLPNDLFRRH